MRISGVRTFLVGNPWKNWLFVRVDTDEGLYGVGEGTLNAFSATVETAIHELEDAYVGQDPTDIELIMQRMTRDVYSEGGQIHMSAVAAIEVACWDILGKATERPVHQLMGGRMRDRTRAYANGWYRTDRTPEAFAEQARRVAERGYTAMKFDPFGAAWRVQDRRDEDLSIDIVAAVREAVGPHVDLFIEGHNRFSVGTALRIADRLAEHRPGWFEEPVAHQNIASVVEVARRSPVPVATGESLTSLPQLAELLRHDAVHIIQPEPLYLGGLLRTRQAAAMVDAHYGVVAPHNAQGPVCAAVSAQLGACIPNFYVQETFEVQASTDITTDIVDEPVVAVDGYVQVPTRPGLGIDLDWDRLAGHPYERANFLPLFVPGWEKRGEDRDWARD
jgi:galactonate dehydratase